MDGQMDMPQYALPLEFSSDQAPSRHEKSLGLLTTKFVSLLQEAKDGVLDLKVVSAIFLSLLFVNPDLPRMSARDRLWRFNWDGIEFFFSRTVVTGYGIAGEDLGFVGFSQTSLTQNFIFVENLAYIWDTFP